MTARRRQYAGRAAVRLVLETTIDAIQASGLDLDVAGISLSPDGGVTVLTGKRLAPHLSVLPGDDDGWAGFK